MAKDQPAKEHEGNASALDYVLPKQLFAERKIGNYNSIASGGSKQEINEGPIKKVDIPQSWQRSSDYNDAVGSVTKFSPGIGDSSINSVEHSRPIDKKCMQTFSDLIDHNPNLTKPIDLTPDQIRSLTEALGPNTLGDNQYTNKNPYPGANSPNFNMTRAQLKTINGHTVMEVEGSFMEADGKPTQFYSGILSPDRSKGTVNEFFLAAPDRDEMKQQENTFRRALRSIEWR